MKWGGWLWKADNPRWRITFIHLDFRRSQEIERAQQQQVLKWRGWASLSNTNAYMCACLVNHIHNKTNKLHGPACDKFAMRTASSKPCVRTRNSQRACVICGPACVHCFQRAHVWPCMHFHIHHHLSFAVNVSATIEIYTSHVFSLFFESSLVIKGHYRASLGKAHAFTRGHTSGRKA